MARGGRLGWFLGLVFGTLFGVLFAPRKGQELRARMKADRKKGRLGIAPLQDDMKHLGREIADLAKDIYESDIVQDVVDRVRPEVQSQVNFVKSGISSGRKTAREAAKELKNLKAKVKRSSRIGKKAFGDIKDEMKKKP